MNTRGLTLIALLAAVAPIARAQRGPGGPPGGRGGPPGGRCAGTADSLSDNQKAQVKSLVTAFEQAHQPQLDSLRAIMEAGRAARQAGKSADEIRAIMEQGRAINEALAPARKDFRESVVTLLTTSQIADGCIPPAPGGPPPGGRRGGPPPPLS